MEIPKELQKEFKEDNLKTAQASLYNVYEAQAYNIWKLKKIEADKERKIKIGALDKEILDASKKLKIEHKDKIKYELQRTIDRATFIKNKHLNEVSGLYNKISQTAEKIKELEDKIEFNKEYTFGPHEELPYAEVNGTHYSMKNNIIETDDLGGMILHLSPAKK